MIYHILRWTWYNPIFMMIVIGAIWFVPGIILRKNAERRYKEFKNKKQEEAIARLYPDKDIQN